MAEAASQKFTKFLIIFVVGVIILKNATSSGIFEAKNHKGDGYFVVIPQGWKKVKGQKNVQYPEGVEVVMFVPKEIDVETEIPDVYISIFSKKLTSPIWIEDEFPTIVKSIANEGNKVMDKGELKLDGKMGEWLVYYNEKAPSLNLEFYTVNDNSMFYKLQYTAHPDKFNKMRPSFEQLRESFIFRFSIF